MLARRRANSLAAANHTRATPRGPRPRPPLHTGGWRARVCTLPLALARRRLQGNRNNLGYDAEQALKAAARSGLELAL